MGVTGFNEYDYFTMNNTYINFATAIDAKQGQLSLGKRIDRRETLKLAPR